MDKSLHLLKNPVGHEPAEYLTPPKGAIDADRPLVVVTGLAAESRIAAGTGIVCVAGGGDEQRLASLLRVLLDQGAGALLSFGIAGGLRPDLAPGDTIIARHVSDAGFRFAADPLWSARLARALPQAVEADLVGVDAPVCGIDAKAALHRASGAAAVDMESHVAARLAQQFALPFAALRIIADPAHRTVPRAAALGMRPDGTTDIGAVLRALAEDPRQLPHLIRTAFDARAAFAALRTARRRLGPAFGLGPLNPQKGKPV